jgi:hypothetical protein
MDKAMAIPEEETLPCLAGRYLLDILPALQRLDRLLERAVIAAATAYGAESATDRFRGMHISTSEVERLLARVPGAPLLWVEPMAEVLRQSKRSANPG